VVGPAHRILVHTMAVQIPSSTQYLDPLGFECAASGGDDAFLIEYRCDLGIHFVFSVQLDHPFCNRSTSMQLRQL